MKYTKRIITAFLFIMILAGLLYGASGICVPKTNEPGSGMEEVVANGIMGEKAGTIDVLFLGDSESHSTFIPLQIWKDTGYTSYNCGTGDQTLDYSLTMLRRALKKQDLKIVFLEANAIYYKESKEVPYAMLCEMFPVFRYHNRWKTLTGADFTEKPDYTWTDDNKGYHYSAEVVPSYQSNYLSFDMTNEKSRIIPVNRYYVKAIKRLCDKNGIELIFVSTPSSANFTYKRHNATTALAEELGCEFIDMNMLPDEIGIDWSKDTKDKGNHLNFAGATKATAWMSEYLQNTGALESHKGDADYASWDDNTGGTQDEDSI